MVENVVKVNIVSCRRKLSYKVRVVVERCSAFNSRTKKINSVALSPRANYTN
jgi:hypothetical protein